MDYSLPGSSVRGILTYQPVKLSLIVCVYAQWLSCVQLCVTPWTVAHLALLSMRLSMQEYWSGLPFPPPGDLPDPGIKPTSPEPLALLGGFFTTEPL